jgi:acetyltransferase-like isoleucine patch superfamily enzyme
MYRKAGINIGDPRGFGGHVWIDMWAPVSIAEDVLMGGYTFILTHTWMGTPKVEGVTIKRGAQIGVRVIIMPGVTIGVAATVGAGSVVTHNVPDYAVVAGSPARLLRMKK